MKNTTEVGSDKTEGNIMYPLTRLSKAIGDSFSNPEIKEAFISVYDYVGELEDYVSKQSYRIQVLEELVKEIQEEYSYLKDRLRSRNGSIK